MKAWVLHEVNNLEYEEIDIPVLRDGEVLVKVKTAGICGSDIPRIYRDGAHRMPLTPGHEFAGEVVLTGKWVDETWLHKRVGVYPLIPCRECTTCWNGDYEMCRQYSYIGSRQDGAFAEYVAVPVKNLIELPEQVGYEQAAMLEPMAVAVHAMRQAEVTQTDIVVVYGLGTIGLLLTMFLLEKGIKNLFVIGNKASQKAIVKQMGISDACIWDANTKEIRDWLHANTNGYGADIVFECVGKNETISDAIELATQKGTVCIVGNPNSDIMLKKSVYWNILRNQLRIVGTWNSSFFQSIHNSDEYGYYEECTDWDYVLQKLKTGSISPEKLISHKIALEELGYITQQMRDKLEEYIKVMIYEK